MNRIIVDSLRGIAIFTAIAEFGSFRAAANHLRLAPSRISEILTALERQLGVQLINRTTRHLSLTPEGKRFLRSAQQMVSAAEQGVDAIGSALNTPMGDLHVALPSFVQGTRLMDGLADYARAHPSVNLSLDFSDHPNNLVEGKYDVAIRAGFLEYSESHAESLFKEARMLVASPSYIAGRSKPENPSDLADWDWIQFAMRPKEFVFVNSDKRKAAVTGQSHVMVDSVQALYAFAVRGIGITVLPEHLAAKGIGEGILVHVLPDWHVPDLGVHAIWPGNKQSKLVGHFVSSLKSAMKQVE